MRQARWMIGLLTVAMVAALTSSGARGDESAGAKTLGVEDYETGDVEVSLLEVKRTSGDTVTVKWALRNKGEKEQTIEKLISDEHYLVDAAAKKKYFIVKDSEQNYVALDRDYNQVKLKPGQNFKVWAKFPAPPAATEKVTVYIRGVAPFEDVPIEK